TPAINSDVATGRRMNGSEMLTILPASSISRLAVFPGQPAFAAAELSVQHASLLEVCIDHQSQLARRRSIPSSISAMFASVCPTLIGRISTVLSGLIT